MIGSEGQGQRKASGEPSEPSGTAEDSSSTPGGRSSRVEGRRHKTVGEAGRRGEERKIVFVFKGDFYGGVFLYLSDG